MTTLQLVNAQIHAVLEGHAIICRTRVDEDIVIHRMDSANVTIDIRLYTRDGEPVGVNQVIPPGKMIIDLYGPLPARDYLHSYDTWLTFGNGITRHMCDMTFDVISATLGQMGVDRIPRDWSDYKIAVYIAELVGPGVIREYGNFLACSVQDYWSHVFDIPRQAINELCDCRVDEWSSDYPPDWYFDEACMFLHKYPEMRPRGSVNDFSMYWKMLRGLSRVEVVDPQVQPSTKHPAMLLSADIRQNVRDILAKIGVHVDASFDAVLDVCWTWDGEDWRNPDEYFEALKIVLDFLDAHRPPQQPPEDPLYFI